MGELFTRIYDFFERRRALLWALVAAMVTAMAFFAARVRYEEQITGFFRGGEEGRRQAMIFDHLKVMDKVAVMFTAADAKGDPDPYRAIAAAEAFERHLASGGAAGLAASVTSGVGEGEMAGAVAAVYDRLPTLVGDADYRALDSLLAPGGVERRMEEVRDRLSSPLGMAVRDVALADPLGVGTGRLAALQVFSSVAKYEIYDGHIFSPDLRTMLMVVEPNHGIGDTGANEPLMRAIERAIVQTAGEGFGDVRAEYTGGPSVAVANARQIKADTWLTLSVALAITVAFILLALRNRLAVLLVTTPVLFGVLFALAAIWLGGQQTMSAIAVGAGAAVLGVALSYSVHVISHANHTDDPRQIVRDLAGPLTVGGFTTIGAFLGLTFTGSRLLRDLGLFASLTLVGTTLFCLVVLPHLLGRGGGAMPDNAVRRLVERIGAYPWDRRPAAVWGLVGLTVVCLFFYGRVGFDSDMMNLNYTAPHLRAAEERLAAFTGEGGPRVMLVATGRDFEQAHASMRAAGEILDSLRAEGLVEDWVSAADFLPPPSLQRERIERWERYWSGGRREETLARLERSAAANGFRPGAFAGFAALLTKEQSAADFAATPPPPMLADWMSVADDGTPMLVAQVAVEEARKEAVYARLARLPEVVVVDRSYFAGRMARGVRDDFNLVLAIASALIFVALVISYGRVELTLVAFMPMVVSWVIILGLMAMLGVEFNIVSIILSTFIFGIGDDFSIFIMDGLLSEYRDGRRTLAAHKTAIFFSAFTILVGLGVLVVARHPAMRSLAVVSVVGIVAVIAVAYVLQPVVFRAMVTSQTRRGGFPYTLAGLANTLYAFVYFLVGCALLHVVMLLLAPLPIDKKRKKLWVHRAVSFAARFFLRTMVTTRRVELNEAGEDFARPAVVVANHQSFIDILVLLGLTPRLVMVTNSWVWRSPFFGWIVRYADFFHTADGYERLAGELREKVADGYSVAVFPEGTRSADMKIGRFHKGAFLLAERLGLDILPVVMYGNGLVSSKRQPLYIKKGLLVSRILPRIALADPRFGASYSERARRVGEWFRSRYADLYEEWNRARNPHFFDALIKSYTYKGPVLEWYMRVKVRMERSYDLFDRTVPRDARVVDIGCGYGATAHMLAMLSDGRRVLGIDYDEEKIAVARHSFLCAGINAGRTEFVAASALDCDLPRADVFILSDVLHYMEHGEQDLLLARCFERLDPGGMVIVRDGDSSERERHRTTERTERWSTRLVRFNKTAGALHFTDSERIVAAARRAGFGVRIVDGAGRTSNKVYICTAL
jgi:1-acyl-sn-glycerol-3-phosphate acyltransferase